MTSEKSTNPYIEAFWKWLPTLINKMSVFRLTGGEPLLDCNTFKTLDYLQNNPVAHLTLAINSNLNLPFTIFSKFTTQIKKLLLNKSVKNFELYASIDTFGQQAEYLRFGLKYSTFIKNLEFFCQETPNSKIVLMCTYNILSIPHFHIFLKHIANLKKKYSNINLDITHLAHPNYLRANLITNDFVGKIEKNLDFMAKKSPLFNQYEIEKLERTLNWVKAKDSNETLIQGRSNFFLFINEYDTRKKLSFLKIFPEYVDFFNLCKKSHTMAKKIPGELHYS